MGPTVDVCARAAAAPPLAASSPPPPLQEEVGLKTRALREADERARAEGYGPVAVRVHLPDDVILQVRVWYWLGDEPGGTQGREGSWSGEVRVRGAGCVCKVRFSTVRSRVVQWRLHPAGGLRHPPMPGQGCLPPPPCLPACVVGIRPPSSNSTLTGRGGPALSGWRSL